MTQQLKLHVLGPQGFNEVVEARERALEEAEAALAREEDDLRHLHGATYDVEPRYRCSVAERRAQLTVRWQSLVEDKRQINKRAALMAAAIGCPPGQEMDRNETLHGLLPHWGVSATPLQNIWCAIYAVQQFQGTSASQQQQQVDMPFLSCCFQR